MGYDKTVPIISIYMKPQSEELVCGLPFCHAEPCNFEFLDYRDIFDFFHPAIVNLG